jgi:DUF4097 and DUF4098 domain-containing protein YvlB
MTQKKLLKICGCLMALGLVLAAIGFFTGAQLNLSAGSGTKPADSTSREIKKENMAAFEAIDMNINKADIEFVPSDHYGVVINYRGDADQFTCADENGTLTVSEKSTELVHFWWDIPSNSRNTVKVYLPKDTQLKRLNVKNQYGGFTASGLNSADTDIDLSFGSLKLSDASCGKADFTLKNGSSDILNTKSDTMAFHNDLGSSTFDNVTVSSSQEATFEASNGSITMKDFTAGPMEISNHLGSITLEKLTAAELKSKLSNGSLNMDDCKIDNLVAENSLGSIDIRKLDSKGTEIKNSSGRTSLDGTLMGKTTVHSDLGSVIVKTSVEQKLYTFKASSNLGSITLNGSREGNSITQTGSGENSLQLSNNNGSISLDFAN